MGNTRILPTVQNQIILGWVLVRWTRISSRRFRVSLDSKLVDAFDNDLRLIHEVDPQGFQPSGNSDRAKSNRMDLPTNAWWCTLDQCWELKLYRKKEIMAAEGKGLNEALIAGRVSSRSSGQPVSKAIVSLNWIHGNSGTLLTVYDHFMLRMSRFAAPCSHPHPDRRGTFAGSDEVLTYTTNACLTPTRSRDGTRCARLVPRSGHRTILIPAAS
jgi:hypothetical protein